jgi:hypothetical protein
MGYELIIAFCFLLCILSTLPSVKLAYRQHDWCRSITLDALSYRADNGSDNTWSFDDPIFDLETSKDISRERLFLGVWSVTHHAKTAGD